MKKTPIIVMLITLVLKPLAAQTDLPKGIESFEQHRWMESIREFIDVLRQDPQNAQAHEYLALAIKQLDSQKAAKVHDHRLEVLENASKRLEDNRLDATQLRQSIADTAEAEENQRKERWHNECQMAAMEDRLGHLPAANDIVLRVLGEDTNNTEAQRLLSDLQSQIHETLDTNPNLSVIERSALEGFYAYGQADYRTAAAAWAKTHAELEKTLPLNEITAQVSGFHFESYEKVAQAHVEEEDRSTRTQTLFAQGTDLFQKHSYPEALDHFRQVALINPEYPQLGNYLVQSEASTEKERTRRLSQDIRDRANTSFDRGVAALEKNQYAEAKQAFQEVLAVDPSHPQVSSYLSVIETEMGRRYDPHAAQLHYEAGLVSYASGKLEDAVREWRIATRLDPAHEKAASALSKAQKEITRNQEVPG